MPSKPDMTYAWGSSSVLIIEPNDTKKQTGWIVEKPPVEYMNWQQNRTDTYIQHINEQGIPSWDTDTTYGHGALVFCADYKIRYSKSSGNQGNDPLTTTGYWGVFGMSGLIPSLQPLNNAMTKITPLDYPYHFEGFSGDGDYFLIPTASTGPLIYYDNTGSSIFSISPSDINAVCDYWVGFTIDSGVLYIVAVDVGTTPDTFYLASVDITGAVTNIGNDQPSVDFINAGTYWGSGITAGATNIQRAAVGSGNLFIRMTTNSATIGAEEAEINITTGAFVSSPSSIFGMPYNHTGGSHHYKTTNGVYLGSLNTDDYGFQDNNPFLIINLGKSRSIYKGMIPIQNILLMPDSVTSRFMAWKNNVYITGSGCRVWEKTVFDAWVEEVASIFGVD